MVWGSKFAASHQAPSVNNQAPNLKTHQKLNKPQVDRTIWCQEGDHVCNCCPGLFLFIFSLLFPLSYFSFNFCLGLFHFKFRLRFSNNPFMLFFHSGLRRRQSSGWKWPLIQSQWRRSRETSQTASQAQLLWLLQLLLLSFLSSSWSSWK